MIDHDVKDISLAPAGKLKIDWAEQFHLVTDSLVKLHPPSEPLAKALNAAVDSVARAARPPGAELAMDNSRSGSGNGSGCNRTPLTTLKIAVFAPMPNARHATAASVKLGVRRSVRMAYRRSWKSVSII